MNFRLRIHTLIQLGILIKNELSLVFIYLHILPWNDLTKIGHNLEKLIASKNEAIQKCFWTTTNITATKMFSHSKSGKLYYKQSHRGRFLLVFLLLFFSINMVGGFKKDPELTCLCTNLVTPILSWSCTLLKTEWHFSIS